MTVADKKEILVYLYNRDLKDFIDTLKPLTLPHQEKA